MDLHTHQLNKYNDPSLEEVAKKADRRETLTEDEKELWETADQDLDGHNEHIG